MAKDSRQQPSIRELLQRWPVQAVKAASALVCGITLIELLFGKVLNRMIVAPDVGIVIILLTAISYGMAKYSEVHSY